MASLPACAHASHSIAALRRPSTGFHAPSRAFITPAHRKFVSHLNLWLKMEVRVQVKKNRLSAVFASNTNPSNDSKMSDAAPGPPFLTIVAGVLVFLSICWIVASIVMWLIGLIVHPTLLK